MENATETDLTFLQNEETIRAFMHLVEPLIKAAVADALLQHEESTRALVQSEVATQTQDFATREYVMQIGKEIGEAAAAPLIAGQTKLQQQVTDHLTELSQETERQWQEFNREIVAVRTMATESQKQIGELKAGYDATLDSLDKRLTKAETDIKTGVAEVVKNTTTLSRAVGQWLGESRKQKEITDKEIQTLKTSLSETREDVLNQRSDVDGLRGDIATKVTTTDLKVKHIDSEISEIKQRQSNQTAEQELVKKWVIEIQVQLKSALWLLNTWGGRMLIATILTLLGLSNLVN